METSKTIRIGNAGGYWGDDLSALGRQLRGGPLDYVSIDFLAEITMSIMQKQKDRDPSAGYARDFVEQMRECLPLLVERDVRIITNAGGVNPRACAGALLALARELKLPVTVGIVEGDDLMGRIGELRAQGVSLEDMETGAPFARIDGKVSSANAYFGAAPVVRALREGARIVVTGRTTDTGITLAPMMHAFEWSPTDWSRLALGIIAGHIIECGCQATGGNFTDWERVPSFDAIGYPIVEVAGDGSFVVTKHPGTGGLVTCATVKEQLVYEMGDPRNYLTPDVIADFTSVSLGDDGPDRVRVEGGRGTAPTDQLKVSVSYRAGYKASGGVIICGPRALDKARLFTDLFWKRYGTEVEEHLTEYVGHDSCHRHLSASRDPDEVFLRLGVRDPDAGKVQAFSKLLPSIILSGPPGVSATGGRPQVQEVVAYWPTLVPRGLVEADVALVEESGTRSFHLGWDGPTSQLGDLETTRGGAARATTEQREPARRVKVPLSRICHGRSGDKGDTVNIGLIARHPDVYPILVTEITPARVKEFMGDICRGFAFRYEVPNLHAVNFLLTSSLGGGGTLALQFDPQGKTLSHALMRMEIEIDEDVLAKVDRGDE